MNLEELQYFLEIVRCKSINKAAKSLFMTPQGLSQKLKHLEHELDTTLLVRTGNGIILTESGEYLHERLPSLLHEFQRIHNELQCIKERENHEIHLLSAYGILRLVTPECLMAFQEAYPHISVDYREYPDHVVEDFFLNGKGNVAFTVGNDVLKHVTYTPMERFELKLLVNRRDPLAKKEKATLQDLASRPFYIENNDFHIYHMILDACKKEGIDLHPTFETCGFSLCHKMVEQNKGISVSMDFMFQDMYDCNVCLIPFEGSPFYWETYMLTRNSEKETPDLILFRDFVTSWMKKKRRNTLPLEEMDEADSRYKQTGSDSDTCLEFGETHEKFCCTKGGCKEDSCDSEPCRGVEGEGKCMRCPRRIKAVFH